ncbi:hypothetical protein E1200_10085 [Actinomadura sp. GC306]|uniref:hypothetical protein n=1 Tax=Actinomadura sp. GC306 TaxID=2530367 RepID=UPI00104EE1C9|nr:hypothetical protein [Actinomadura sp. GC306]TDC68965.1 hypothetical protein E1200_10085 [Actinomadura sp. GC306]
MISIRRKPQEEVLTRFDRVQEAARQAAHQGSGMYRQGAVMCRQGVSSAAERIRPAADERVMAVRGWSAPRLRQAARYVETGLAPRVSTFLSDTAQRVEPPRHTKSGRSAFLAMMGVVTAIGVAGVVATRRDTIRDMAKGSGEHAGDATSADSMTVTGADVDGQVHSPH